MTTAGSPSLPVLRWSTVVLVGLWMLAGPVGCQGPEGLNGADNDRPDDNYAPVPVESQCSADQTLCDRECVDVDDHALHCGECGNRCPDGTTCRLGECLPQQHACPETPCTGFTYCDDGVCRPGCQTDTDCTGGRVCNPESRRCECPDGGRLCGGKCFDYNDPAACGDHCLRCPSGGGSGEPNCVDGTCRLECGEGKRSCDGRCVTCPDGAVETKCVGGGCVPTECEGDRRACGSACSACPEGAAETTCRGEECVASECIEEHHGICDGRCVECPVGTTEPSCEGGECRAAACGEDMRACGGECVECPADAAATTCRAGECVPTDCRENLAACDGECVPCPPAADRTTCQQGYCVEQCVGYFQRLCPGDFTCTDTAVDADHCGSCGNECGVDESCEDGECVPNYVYTASADETVRKLDPDGELVWTLTEHDAPVRAVAVDAYNFVYTGSDDQSVQKFNAAGNQFWRFDEYGEAVADVAVAEAGYVFAAGAESTIRQFEPGGQEIFDFEIGPPGFDAVAAGRDGFWYAGSQYSLWKLGPSGDTEWSVDFESFRDVATGEVGYVYVIADSDLVRLDAETGEEDWRRTASDRPRRLAVDDGGDVYIVSDDRRLRKLDGDSGDELWSYEAADDIEKLHGLAAGLNGSIYLTADDRVRRLSGDGDVVWTYDGHDGAVYDVAVDPGPYGAFPEAWGE